MNIIKSGFKIGQKIVALVSVEGERGERIEKGKIYEIESFQEEPFTHDFLKDEHSEVFILKGNKTGTGWCNWDFIQIGAFRWSPIFGQPLFLLIDECKKQYQNENQKFKPIRLTKVIKEQDYLLCDN